MRRIKNHEMMFYTDWESPKKKVYTVDGIITFEEWVKKEKERFISHDRIANIVKDKEFGLIALQVDRIA